MTKAIIIEVRTDGDGFVVSDARLRRHEAPDVAALGRLVARLLHDHEIPKVEARPLNEDIAIVSRVARTVSKKVKPEAVDLIDSAEPIAHQALDLFTRARDLFGKKPATPPRRTKPKPKIKGALKAGR